MRYLIASFTFLLSVTFCGQNDYSLSFDELNDAVHIQPVFSGVQNNFSIGAWVQPENFNGWGSIFLSRSNDHYLNIESSTYSAISGTVQVRFGLQISGSQQIFGDINVNQWNYVVGTYDGLTQKLFVNGVLVDSQSSNIGNANWNETCWTSIGGDGLSEAGCSGGFTSIEGKLDNVQLWDFTLTQQDVEQYMCMSLTGNEAGLVGYWNFEEGSGTTAFDQTLNGNDGAINGATYSTDVPEQNCIDDICAIEGSNGEDIVGFFSPNYYNGKYFYVSLSNMYSYGDASSLANDLGGQLADVSTEEELSFFCGMENVCCTSSAYFINNYQAIYNQNNDDNCEIIDWPGEGTIDLTGNHQFIMEIIACPSSGCLDETACNYNPEASIDDGSCEYITPVDLGEDITTCDESVTLDAGEGYDSYLWSNEETTQSIEVSESGDYSVEVGDGNENNSSLSFDGLDDYVEVSNDGSFVLSDFSVSFFIKTSAFSGALIQKDANPEPVGGDWNIAMWDGFITVNVRKESGSEAGYAILGSSSSINDDTWHSVCVTRNAVTGLVQLFIDGDLEDSGYGPLGHIFNEMDLNFGRQNYNFTDHFQGNLDDIAIWNEELANAAVNELSNCAPNGNEEALLGYWNFEEGNGTTAYDQTGNGNDGTINGATWSSETPEQNCSSCSSSDEITVTINVCGCTDSEAVNYNLEANEDDGSCCYDIDYVNDTYDEGYADGVDSVICPENNCPSDLNLDGIVSTADLLMFLVQFGTICE